MEFNLGQILKFTSSRKALEEKKFYDLYDTIVNNNHYHNYSKPYAQGMLEKERSRKEESEKIILEKQAKIEAARLQNAEDDPEIDVKDNKVIDKFVDNFLESRIFKFDCKDSLFMLELIMTTIKYVESKDELIPENYQEELIQAERKRRILARKMKSRVNL